MTCPIARARRSAASARDQPSRSSAQRSSRGRGPPWWSSSRVSSSAPPWWSGVARSSAGRRPRCLAAPLPLQAAPRGRRPASAQQCGPSRSRAHSSLSRLIRSSSGGWVSNSLWIDRSFPWSPTPAHGLLDPQVCRGRGRRVRHRRVVPQFFQSGDQSGWIPRELARADVGQRFAPPGDRRLHRLGDDRGEDQQGEAEDGQRVAAGRRGRRRDAPDRRSTTSCGSPCR